MSNSKIFIYNFLFIADLYSNDALFMSLIKSLSVSILISVDNFSRRKITADFRAAQSPKVGNF